MAQSQHLSRRSRGRSLPKKRSRLPLLIMAIVLIALTGYGQQEDRLQTRAAGFDDHLVKPVDLDSLRNAIERVAPSTT